jgi:hypothetical protein
MGVGGGAIICTTVAVRRVRIDEVERPTMLRLGYVESWQRSNATGDGIAGRAQP